MFRKKRLWRTLTASFMLLFFCSSVFAASLQDRLDSLKQQATDKQTQINSTKAKENSISDQMR